MELDELGLPSCLQGTRKTVLALGLFVSDTEPGVLLPRKAEGRGTLTPSSRSQWEAERPGSEARGSRKKCVCLCVWEG